MPKPKNETIASCPCSVKGCTEQADVRREKNHERGAMYIVCPRHTQPLRGVDDYIGANMVAEPVPDQEPAGPATVTDTPDPVTDTGQAAKPHPASGEAEPGAEPEKKPKQKEAGFFRRFTNEMEQYLRG